MAKGKMLILTISHNIFLTRKQRYELIESGQTTTIGVSVPVWFYKGSTSEPAIEVFSKYLLSNNSKIPGNVIEHTKGYHINLPNHLDKKDMIEILTLPTVDSLRDIKDNGSEYMYFKYTKKMPEDSKITEIHHHIDINNIEALEESLLL